MDHTKFAHTRTDANAFMAASGGSPGATPPGDLLAG